MIEPEEVIQFWFADALYSPAATAKRNEFWFSSNKELDEQIWEKFGDAVTDAANGRYADWASHNDTRLALIILLDQFPRNIFRSTAEAFRFDDQALELTREGVAAGQLGGLSVPEQAFYLMPYQHVEDLTLQDEGIQLYNAMAVDAPSDWEEVAIGYRNFAVLHRNIVADFGRFPHRNAFLGRASTEAERLYLQEGGESFGQNG